VLLKKAFLFAAVCLTTAATGSAIASKEEQKKTTSHAVFIAQAGKADASGNDTWIPIGYNKDRVAAAWVQLKSYEELNENSFRVNAKSTNDKGVQVVGRLDLNCRNKDWYSRPNGVVFQGAPWATVPTGSGIESLAQLLCKKTSAKAEWGYSPQIAYLWDYPATNEDPANASGEWVKAYDGDDGEAFYNTSVTKVGDVVTFAGYSRTKKGDRTAAKAEDSAKYVWFRSSCIENLASEFYKPDVSVNGVWLPPAPGRPGGTGFAVKKAYCK
jgi:hypothetical protein